MPRSQEGEEEVSVMTDSSEPKKKKQGSSEAAVIRSNGENPLSAQPQEEEDDEQVAQKRPLPYPGSKFGSATCTCCLAIVAADG